MPLPEERTRTIEDIYALPEGERAELIDGQIYYMAPPGTTHQRILSFLHLEIANYIRNRSSSCEVFPAPFAVFLEPEDPRYDKNYLEPDLSVICDPNKIDEKGYQGAPDWVIEIISPGSRRMDYFTKVFKYHTAGVREYWIVDPDKNRITVWNFEKDDNIEYSFEDSVESGIYPGFYIDFCSLDI